MATSDGPLVRIEDVLGQRRRDEGLAMAITEAIQGGNSLGSHGPFDPPFVDENFGRGYFAMGRNNRIDETIDGHALRDEGVG